MKCSRKFRVVSNILNYSWTRKSNHQINNLFL